VHPKEQDSLSWVHLHTLRLIGCDNKRVCFSEVVNLVDLQDLDKLLHLVNLERLVLLAPPSLFVEPCHDTEQRQLF